MFKRVLFISLSVILALLITLTTIFIVDIAYQDSFRQKGDEYFIVGFEKDSAAKGFINEDCLGILDEFGITSIVSANEVLSAQLTASSQGQSVLIVTTKANISNKATYYTYPLCGESSELKCMALSGIVTGLGSHKLRQLWRSENDEVRVTAYKGIDIDRYYLSVRLPIDKFEFAKQNGTKTSGFPMGKGEIKL